MRQHLAAQVANLLPLKAQVDDAEGAVREVDYCAAERFVERCVGTAETREAGCGVECGLEGLKLLVLRTPRRQLTDTYLSKSDTGVLGSVVVVNVQVAFGPDPQTPAGVFGEGVQHVVEKANASVDVYCLRLRGLSGVRLCFRGAIGCYRVQGAAVEVYRELDLGLICVAVDCRGAYSLFGHCWVSSVVPGLGWYVCCIVSKCVIERRSPVRCFNERSKMNEELQNCVQRFEE